MLDRRPQFVIGQHVWVASGDFPTRVKVLRSQYSRVNKQFEYMVQQNRFKSSKYGWFERNLHETCRKAVDAMVEYHVDKIVTLKKMLAEHYAKRKR